MTKQTYNSPPREVPPEEVSQTLVRQLESLDPQRAQAIAGLHRVRIARADGYAREKERLTLKYGAEHPRLIALAGKMRVNEGLTRDLQFEAVRTKAGAPFVDQNNFAFHGFVRNCAGEPKPGLTVALYDAQGGWIRAMGYSCTDQDGYFRMQGTGFSVPADGAAAVATIRVYDKQTLLVTDAEPLPITPGKSEYRIIIVCDDGTCPPPPGDPDEPPPAPATVPNVVGKSEDAAKAQLKKAGFTARSSTRGGPSKEIGQVLEQKPEGGALAAQGSEVAIVVGTAEARLSVPDVVRETLRDAKTRLENGGFIVGKVDPANAPVQNRVVKQSPKAGAEAERDSAVDLVIEVPVTTIKVPAVEKLPLGRARTTILERGLTVGKITPDGAGDEQIVIAQSPKAGTEVEQKAAVDLSIEEGKGPVTVPNLKGLRLAEARTSLAALQLTVRKILPPGATEKFMVISHVPMAGTKVEKGTPVDVVLAPVPPTTQPPKKSATKKKPSRPRKKRKPKK